jgi:uroporphyrinogen decarboxylase
VDRDIGVVANCLLPEPRLEGYAFPDPGEKGIFDHVPAFIAENRERFRVGGIGFSLFERAWTMRGMENLLADMYDHPAFVEELLDAIAEYNLALIDRMLEFDLDAIRFGDDWGCQRGVIMGPPLWRRFIKPRLARMYGRVRAGGRKVMIHCCGCVEELFDDLIEIGLNIFNPFQPEVMDTLAVKRKYGDRLAFYGGISIQRLLPYGTPDEIERKVKRLLGELGRRGGYIAAPAHGLPGDIPAENIHAMLEVFWEQAGVEPLAPPV